MKHNKGDGGREDYFINLCHKKVFLSFFRDVRDELCQIQSH